MQEYLSQAKRIQTKFEFFNLSYIPRNGNTHADFLATLATSSAQDLPRVILVEDLCTPTPIKRDFLQVHQIKLGPSWMDLILLFLERDVLPEEKSDAEKVRRKAPRFWMSEDKKLYKRFFLDQICFVYIPMHQNHSWNNCMKGFAEVTQEEDFYLIEPLHKDTGG